MKDGGIVGRGSVSSLRREVRDEISRTAADALPGIKDFLRTYPDDMSAYLRTVPWSDEPDPPEVIRLVEEAREWLRENGGRGIPHEQIVRELGIE